MRSVSLARLLCVALVGLASGSVDYNVAADSVYADLTNGTSSDGYTVQNGSYFFFFISDCATYNLDTCFLLNADSPYGMTMLPSSPVEVLPYLGAVTPSLTGGGAVGDGCQTRNGVTYPEITPRICQDGRSMQWRLGYDEAIVLIGKTPPPAIYWSFTSYVFTQHYNESARTVPLEEVPFGSKLQGAAVSCPEPPARCQIGGSLGTPFNHHILSGMTGGTGFNETFALILTASRKAAAEVSAAMEKAGLQPYLLVYPSDMLDMGTDNNFRDTFTMFLRIAYPENDAEMEEYYQRTPVRTMRVTPKSATAASSSTKLDGAQQFEAVDTVWVDRDLYQMENAPGVGTPTPILTADQLNASLYRLGAAIHEKHGGRYTDTGLLQQWFSKGLECTTRLTGTMCNLDCPDTLYPLSNQAFRAVGRQALLDPQVQEALGLKVDEVVDSEKNKILAWGIPTVGAVLLVVLLVFVWWVPPPGDNRLARSLREIKRQTLAAGCCAPPRERDGTKGTWFGLEGPPDASHPSSRVTDVVASVEGDAGGDAVKGSGGASDKTDAERGCMASWARCSSRYRYDLAVDPCVWWGTLVLTALFGLAVGTSPLWVQWADGIRKRDEKTSAAIAAARETCDDGHLATIDGGPTRQNDFYVVYGVNHAATGRASYSSINIYYYEKLSGVKSFSSQDGYAGSASVYLEPDDPAVDYLYARSYSRNCTAAGLNLSYCFDVPSNGSLSVPPGGSVMWVARMYDNPHTHAGPLPEQTLMGRVTHFS